MQLREYAAIMRRFWPLIVILPLLVAGLSAISALRQPTRYAASARVMITQAPLALPPDSAFPDFNLQNSWASSSYIVDDMPQIATGLALAEDISAILAEQGYTISPEEVRAGMSAGVVHRAITLNASAADPVLPPAMLRGAISALQRNGLTYWGRSSAPDPGLSVAVLDPPGAAAPLNTTRGLLLDVGLRSALALAAAVGLAFLAYYLDDRLHTAAQAERWLGTEVVGVIPKE
jgi:capsular polysaccharide biosynthesis protein